MFEREFFFFSEGESGENIISNREYVEKRKKHEPDYVSEYITMPNIKHPVRLAGYAAAPDSADEARFVLQVFHGVCERYERYKPLIREIVSAGGVVVIHDMRGHGLSIGAGKTEFNMPGFTGDGGRVWQNYIVDADFAREAAIEHYEEFLADQYAEEDYDEQGYSISEWTKKPAQDLRGLPFYLMGFSMGAMVAAMYASHAHVKLDGLILAGLPKRESPLPLSAALAGLNLMALFFGENYRSPLLNRLSMSHYNRGFQREPYSDGRFLWLSNDYENRMNFASDPLCNHKNPVILYETLFRLVRDVYKPASWDVPEKNLPILLMAGENDPVSGGDEGVLSAQKFLCDMGFRSVDARMYQGLRHEIFYDFGRDAPIGDLIEFVGGAHKERTEDKIEAETC